jgi:response regulator RpfG family c-di-GMP phosphodiesterase
METRKTIRGSLPTRSERQEQESILVADPDVRVIELLQITLSGRGYAVFSALDGESALEEVERRQPDLVVLGVRLPRQSGFQVLEALRANPDTASLPVILVSGSPSNEARIQGLRLGADDYLVKPFSPRELIIKIRRILDRVADLKLLQVKTGGLEEEAQRQRDEMLRAQQEMNECLVRISSLLRGLEEAGRRHDLDEVLEGLVQASVRDLGLERVCFLVRAAGTQTLQPRASWGVDERALRGLTLSVDGLLAQTLALEGRTLTAEELGKYPMANEDLLRLSAAGFTHFTPMRQEDGQLLGVIAGGEPDGERPIDRFEFHLLSVLARTAVIALENVSAFGNARRSFLDTTAQLIATVEARHEAVRGHSRRVHDLALRLAEPLALPDGARETVAYAALLHDLGALDRYEHLFGEDRLLSDEERMALRRHTCEGVRRLLETSQAADVADAVYHLNEHWDGTGLPDGLAHEAIPEASRVVAIANAYDALTHRRPHRPAYRAEEAIQIIRDRAGHQFAPAFVAAFERAMELGEELDPAQSLSMPTMRGPVSRSK